MLAKLSEDNDTVTTKDMYATFKEVITNKA